MLRLVRFVSSKEDFDNNDLDSYFEFRPGLHEPTEGADPDDHPGFDFEHGGLYYLEREGLSPWSSSLQMYCGLEEAKEWIDRHYDGHDVIEVE